MTAHCQWYFIGIPKDQNYLYKVYIARKKYTDAGRTAITIASQEQDIGNYKAAHAVVVETIRQLEDSSSRVPHQLRQLFVLLHSYVLIKTLVKNKNHDGAARLLLRVAQNVSKFPKHMVPILTSTVIECQRAVTQTCHNSTQTCHNSTQNCHNLTRNCNPE